MMALQPCWKCLCRASERTTTFSSRPCTLPTSSSIAPFSSSAPRSRLPEPSPQEGKRSAFRQAKAGRPAEDKLRRPVPGARKALRKRIILSNTNALEVPNMRDISREVCREEGLKGQVLGIPGAVVDQLRAVEAFKPTQAWGLFWRPSMLVRQETLEYANLIEELSQNTQTSRRVLVGERGSGKSVLALQAMVMGFLRRWTVINIPDARDLVIGDTAYAPIFHSSSNILYAQKDYTVNLLKAISLANPHLANLTLSTPPSSSGLPIPIPPNISLARLASLGAQDPDIAWRVFTLLMTELTRPNSQLAPEQARPPMLLSLDSLAYAMSADTAYRNPSFEPIHAHELAIVDWFMGHLSGRKQLPNGGLVLAATSESNQPPNPTLRLALARLEHQQSSSPQSLAAQVQQNPLLPLPQPIHLQQWDLQGDPFAAYDQRVLSVFENDHEGRVELQRVKGLSKEEARGLMTYWAQSGLLRDRVSEGLVSEKWVLSGQGVVGELERAVVRMRH